MMDDVRKGFIDLVSKLIIRMLIKKLIKTIILEPNDFDDMESCATLIGEAGMKSECVIWI